MASVDHKHRYLYRNTSAHYSSRFSLGHRRVLRTRVCDHRHLQQGVHSGQRTRNNRQILDKCFKKKPPKWWFKRFRLQLFRQTAQKRRRITLYAADFLVKCRKKQKTTKTGLHFCLKCCMISPCRINSDPEEFIRDHRE